MSDLIKGQDPDGIELTFTFDAGSGLIAGGRFVRIAAATSEKSYMVTAFELPLRGKDGKIIAKIYAYPFGSREETEH